MVGGVEIETTVGTTRELHWLMRFHRVTADPQLAVVLVVVGGDGASPQSKRPSA